MRNPARLHRLITPKIKSRSDPFHLIAILTCLALLATPVSSHSGDASMGTILGTVSTTGPDGQSYNACGAKVRLESTSQASSLFVRADESGEFRFSSVAPGSYKLEVALEGFEETDRIVTIHAGETAVENIKLTVNRAVLINYAALLGKLTPRFEERHFTKSDVFITDANPDFVNERSETVRFPGFPSLQMRVLKRSFRLSVSPKVSLKRNHFYPRDYRGNMDSANFGTFSNGDGRRFGIRFVIEKN
jgi:hypothetical protein